MGFFVCGIMGKFFCYKGKKIEQFLIVFFILVNRVPYIYV